MATIFTKIINGEIPCYKITESDKFFAFLDINPMSEGHTLVVPKEETDYIFDLNDELYSGLLTFSKKIGLAIEKALPCKRIGLMVYGLEVPHAHVHLIPIRPGVDMSLSKPKLSLSSERFEEIAGQIKAQLV